MSAIRASGIGKCYRRYRHPADGLKEIVFRRPYHKKFWALRGVSFLVPAGQSLGVIGDNGAGKSTLLKLIAGTLQCSEGDLKVKGRVSAILELGSGFHRELTGVENIRLGCAMLGLDAAETAERIPEIIEFSELGEFVHQPVKTYSSGMYVRLAFSVVTAVEPDLLIVDEALSVGDRHFQKKCVDRMNAFRERGATLVYCSHSLYQVKEMSDRVLWMQKGRLQMIGDADDVVDAYQDHARQLDAGSPAKPPPGPAPASARSQPEDRPACFVETELSGHGSQESGLPLFRTHDSLTIRAVARAPGQPASDVHLGIIIKRNDGLDCFGISTLADGEELERLEDDLLGATFVIDDLPLLSGEYHVEAWLIDASGVHAYDSREPCCRFVVRQDKTALGVAWIPHRWESAG